MKTSATIRSSFASTIVTATLVFVLHAPGAAQGTDCGAARARIELPPPTGPHPIGTVTVSLRDDARREIASENAGDRRELVVQLWYPARTPAGGETVPYMKDVHRFAGILGPEFLEVLCGVRTHAYEGAPVSDALDAYPVVLFSPGFRMSRSYYTAVVEDLASHGYFVAAIDHPHMNLVVVPEDRVVDPQGGFWHGFPVSGAAGSAQEARERLDLALEHFGGDHRFVLRTLERADVENLEPFADRLDPSRVASVGHSAGALAPMGLMGDGTEVDGLVVYDVNVDRLLAGPGIVVSVGEPGAPILQIVLEYALPPEAAYTERHRATVSTVTVANATHNSVSDLPYLISAAEGDEEGRETAREGIEVIREHTREFLDTRVKNLATPGRKRTSREPSP